MRLFLKALVKKNYLALIILLLSFITFYADNITVSSDMGSYMNSAMNINIGKGYTDNDGTLIINRGPLFPILIAFSYWILGISPWSAFWVVRIIAVLNPLVIYFLGKKFFGKWIGFSAALLALSSYSLNFWSYRHLDHIWPFFVLLSVFSIYLALEKKSYVHFILSAFFMSSAYLIKQAPILLFPLPLLLWVAVGAYRNKKNLYGSILFILITFSIISPWVYFAYSHSYNIKFALLGGGGKTAAFTTLKTNLFHLPREYLLGLLDYYKSRSGSLSANFSLAPLFVLSWLYAIVKAIRRDRANIMLVACLLLLTPYMSYVGRDNLRVGQLIIFILLSYLALAQFILEGYRIFIQIFQKKLRIQKNTYIYVGAFLIISTALFQSFYSYKNDKGNKNFLKHSIFIKSISRGNIDWQIQGMYGIQMRGQKVVDWISDNIPSGTRLMVDWYWRGRSFYFYTKGDYPIITMPIKRIYQFSEIDKTLQTYKDYSSFNPAIKNNNKKVLFLSSWIASADPTNHFYILLESDLLREIANKNVKYMIISERRNFLTRYFDANPGFLKIAEFKTGAIKIYRVENTMPLDDAKTFITLRASLFLNNLKEKNYKGYIWFRHEFFQNILGWRKDMLSMIEERNYIDGFGEVIAHKIY